MGNLKLWEMHLFKKKIQRTFRTATLDKGTEIRLYFEEFQYSHIYTNVEKIKAF